MRLWIKEDSEWLEWVRSDESPGEGYVLATDEQRTMVEVFFEGSEF